MRTRYVLVISVMRTAYALLVISAIRLKVLAQGGQIDGKCRLKTMTKEQRRKVAAKAAKTRWAKHTKKGNNIYD